MNKDHLKGKRFLEDLLKYATEIGEKTAELAYWRANGKPIPIRRIYRREKKNWRC